MIPNILFLSFRFYKVRAAYAILPRIMIRVLLRARCVGPAFEFALVSEFADEVTRAELTIGLFSGKFVNYVATNARKDVFLRVYDKFG